MKLLWRIACGIGALVALGLSIRAYRAGDIDGLYFCLICIALFVCIELAYGPDVQRFDTWYKARRRARREQRERLDEQKRADDER